MTSPSSGRWMGAIRFNISSCHIMPVKSPPFFKLISICVWIIAVTIMPLKTRADWRAQADARIEKHRKSDYVVTIQHPNGQPVVNQPVIIRQTRNAFHFGTSVHFSRDMAWPDERRYQEFIVEHFNTVVCEDVMKWYAIERRHGVRDYSEADRILQFAVQHNLALRGHCLFWDKPKYVQPWVARLEPEALRETLERHLTETVSRYRGQLIAWDVNNEMLDGTFYKDRLGDDIRVWMFKQAHKLDPGVPLYINEYAILGNEEKTDRYMALIRHLRKQGAPVGGIGIQEHACQRFRLPGREQTGHIGPAYDESINKPLSPEDMMRTLDRLAVFKLPIHLTEITSMTADPHWRADTLETLFRLGFSHPQVEAILLWGFWARRHWRGHNAALVEVNWEINEAGKRLRHLLLTEWRTNLTAVADRNGRITFRGFHGDYEFETRAGNCATATLDAERRKVVVRVRTDS